MIPVIPFVIGGAVGAIGALLLSPRSGEENRELVAEKIDYAAGQGEQIFKRTKDAVYNSAGDTIDDVVEEVEPMANDIREQINEARDRIAEQVMRNREAQPVDATVSDEEPAEEAAEEVAEAAETAPEAVEAAAEEAAEAAPAEDAADEQPEA